MAKAVVEVMPFTFRCPVCKETDTTEVPASVYSRVMGGMAVQLAWPNSTADQREPFVSGMHGKCFDKYMGIED